LPRAADGCIARMMRKPNCAGLTPHCCFDTASGYWFATPAALAAGFSSFQNVVVRWSMDRTLGGRLLGGR